MNREDQIIQALKDNYSAFRDNIWKMATIGVIGVGWLMTSLDARNFISSHIVVKVLFILTLAIGTIAYLVINFMIFRRSQKLVKSAEEIIDKNIYKNYAVTPLYYVFNVTAIIAIYTLGIIITFNLSDKA